MTRAFIRFVREESGEDLIEYGVMAAFVAAMATAVVVHDPLHIENALKGAFRQVKDALRHATK